MIYMRVPIVLSCTAAVFSGFDTESLWLLHFFFDDMVEVYLCLFGYIVCPIGKFPFKMAAASSLGYFIGLLVNNTLVDNKIIPEGSAAAVSFVALSVFSYCFFSILLSRFKSLPNEKMDERFLYQIVGRPRSNIQMARFILLGGLGGSFAVSDSITRISMCKDIGSSKKVPLDESYLQGKKVIKLCPNNEFNRAVYESKVGKKFYLWRDCYWLTKGFKNGTG